MPDSDYHSYSPSDGHELKYNPIKALIEPRPIGWFSTVSGEGDVNLAPYSFFNVVCADPVILMFSSDGRKDTVRNIEETGEFVHNLAPWALVEKVVQSGARYPHGVSELEAAGLTMAASDIVKAPRVAEAPASLECKLIEVRPLTGLAAQQTDCHLVLGQVVRVHIQAKFIKDGIVDEAAMQLAARLGYKNYSKVDATVPKEPFRL